MISTGDVKKGVIIELDGQLMKVLDWSHIKMARGSAQVRMKLQNVRKGDIVERTFQAGTRWPRARVETREAQYLYSDGDAFHFMDSQTLRPVRPQRANASAMTRATSRRTPRSRTARTTARSSGSSCR